MSFLDTVIATGPIPDRTTTREVKKRYSEQLSRNLAIQVAQGLRNAGFPTVKPEPGGPQEKEFQGGLGPKKVDISYSDEQHGLIFAVSIKTITAPPFGKNLKNRFGDWLGKEKDEDYLLNNTRLVGQVWFRGHRANDLSLQPGLYREATRSTLKKLSASPHPAQHSDDYLLKELFDTAGC